MEHGENLSNESTLLIRIAYNISLFCLTMIITMFLFTIIGISICLYLSYGWEGISMLPKFLNPNYW